MSWLSRFRGDDAERTEQEKSPQGEAPVEGVDESAAQAAESGPAAAAVPGEVLAGLRAHLATTLAKGGREVEESELLDDVDMFDAGYLDSLTATEFLVLAERQFNVRLPDWLIGGQGNTLVNLARYIQGEMGSA